jgi:hypothetical protein
MKNEHNKNEALRGPLIFTIPASHFPFLVALNVGWLDVTERTAEEKRPVHKRDGCDSAPRFGDLRGST